MAPNVIVMNPKNDVLAEVAKAAELNVIGSWPLAGLTALEPVQGPSADLMLLDVRSTGRLPVELDAYRRRHPGTRVVVVASSLDVELLREAMRAGVSECLAEPITTVELQAAVRRLSADGGPAVKGKVFAFAGAKGGVGATTVAVNVAAALAAAPGASVMFLDLHTQDPGDAAIFFGVEPRHSILDAVANVHRLDAAFIRGLAIRAACGVDVIAAPSHPPAEPPSPSALHTLLHSLVSHYTHVVIDMPRMLRGMLEAIEPMTTVTLVVTQELSAIRRGTPTAVLLRHQYGKDRVKLVVNRYDGRAEIGSDDVARIVNLPVFTQIRADQESAISAANIGQPLVTNRRNRLGQDIAALADRLNRSQNDPARTGRPARSLAGAAAGIF